MSYFYLIIFSFLLFIGCETSTAELVKINQAEAQNKNANSTVPSKLSLSEALDQSIVNECRELLEQKKYFASRDCGLEIIEKNPLDYRSFKIIGISQLKVGDFKNSLFHLRNAHTYNPQDSEIAIALAESMYKNGLTNESIRFAGSTLNKFPNNIYAKLNLLKLKLFAAKSIQDIYSGYISEMNAILDLNTESYNVRLTVAQVEHWVGNDDSAYELIRDLSIYDYDNEKALVEILFSLGMFEELKKASTKLLFSSNILLAEEYLQVFSGEVDDTEIEKILALKSVNDSGEIFLEPRVCAIISYLKKKRKDDTLLAFAEKIQLYGFYKDCYGYSVADFLIDEGYLHVSIYFLEQLKSRYPQDIKIILLEAKYYLRINNFYQAGKLLETAQNLNSEKGLFFGHILRLQMELSLKLKLNSKSDELYNQMSENNLDNIVYKIFYLSKREKLEEIKLVLGEHRGIFPQFSKLYFLTLYFDQQCASIIKEAKPVGVFNRFILIRCFDKLDNKLSYTESLTIAREQFLNEGIFEFEFIYNEIRKQLKGDKSSVKNLISSDYSSLKADSTLFETNEKRIFSFMVNEISLEERFNDLFLCAALL